MSTTLIRSETDGYGDVTCTGARRRSDASLAGQLNSEWARIRNDPASTAAVVGWAARQAALAGCRTLADVEHVTAAGPSEQTDRILLGLLHLAHDGDPLAGRTVLQLMLGKAIRIAAARAGYDTRDGLEHAAITALWTTIATYPVRRRPTKVAANIAMDTLGAVTGELRYCRSEMPTSPEAMINRLDSEQVPDDTDLLNLLTWAVDQHIVTSADATLILDIYTPAPGQDGGAAAADRHGLTWPAARQRASRAIRRIARAIHADGTGVIAA